MKKMFFMIATLLLSGIVHAADSMQDLAGRATESAQVLQTNANIPDHAIPERLFSRASCIATFPNVIRVGFVFGARYGQGLVSCRVDGGWSSPAYLSITGGSWGLQIGVDSTDLVLVFINPDAINKVTVSKLQLGAGASVAAGPLGRDAAVGTDIKLDSEIYAYSRTRGLYAGLTLDGSILTVDADANTMMYGDSVATVSILRANYFTAPNAVWPYVQALMAIAH